MSFHIRHFARRAGRRTAPAFASLSLAAFLAASLATSLAHAAPVDAYFPKSGVMDARLMIVAGSPEDEQIAEKMKAAIANNRAWLESYVKQHEHDEVLPYDPKFGITEAEYAHIVHPQFHLQEVGRLKITLKRDANGSRVLDVPENAKALSGITIAADGKSVMTPAGVAPAGADIHNTNPDAPTGPWNGVSFASEGDPQHGKPGVELAFGKRDKQGDGIMYYRVSASTQNPAREVVLLYTLD